MNAQNLTNGYWKALATYLADGNETALHRGYELARRALAGGLGVLDIADAHHRALQTMVAAQPKIRERIRAAADFFSECLSPFEMSHRSAQDGTLALRRFNELMEAEHKRIAHALHDEAGQLLASVHLELADLADDLPEHGGERVRHIQQLLKQIESELRNLSHELRPTILDNLGLTPALEFLAEKVAKRTGLQVTVYENVGERLPPEIETALYRIVQEALNNIVKHALAHSVMIDLRRHESGIVCAVGDDGIGIAGKAAERPSGLGLAGIRERLKALGGSLQMASRPGGGTTLRAAIPLRGSSRNALSRAAGG